MFRNMQVGVRGVRGKGARALAGWKCGSLLGADVRREIGRSGGELGGMDWRIGWRKWDFDSL